MEMVKGWTQMDWKPHQLYNQFWKNPVLGATHVNSHFHQTHVNSKFQS